MRGSLRCRATRTCLDGLRRSLVSAVLYVIDPKTFGSGISDVIIAFLTSLCIKIVYEALEKLIMEISTRFQLDSTKSARRSVNVINEFLAEQQGKLDP
jgi:hypothetical protein